MTHHVKNACLTLGFIVTCLTISAVPHMIKWLLAVYVIYMIALWLGNDDED